MGAKKTNFNAERIIQGKRWSVAMVGSMGTLVLLHRDM